MYRSNGDLYFTDPPYGLKGLNADSTKELTFNGVYRLTPSGQLTLLTQELTFPNRAIWMAFEIRSDGSLGPGRVFFDATSLARAGKPGLPDGMKVDRAGNLFATGPGGVFIFSPAGKHLGTIVTGQPTANCAFGDDGSTLYMTANDRLLRLRLETSGVPPGSSARAASPASSRDATR